MSSTRPIKKANFLQLAFMIYGAVCAGAFGLEDMISSAGPGIAILTLLIVPFLFSIPISFAVGELTTMMPVEGGQYRWARRAFGDFWGFQAGWWAWMTGVVTNGIFAVLFANYVEYWLPAIRAYHLAALVPNWPLPAVLQNLLAKASMHWLICLALIWFMHVLNLRGIQVVGNSAILLSIILLIPFAIMLVLGVASWQHNPFAPFHAPGKNFVNSFGSALVIAIWLYSGYDKLSAAAEEVEKPQRVFPPALFFAVTLAMLSYVLPTVAGLAALGNWQEWAGAYFSPAATLIGGAWLGHAMTFGALCSNALLLNVTMLAASRYPLTLAEDGFLPRFLSKLHPKYGTPVQSLFWGSITYSALALFDFTQLTIIYSWFLMSSYILLYANVWMMRRTHAAMPRPFKIPFGQAGLFLAMLPTCVIALVAMGSTVFEEGEFSQRQFLIGALTLLSGPVVYGVVRLLKK
ncbi:MAG: APC family permease [candidate division KSB1 bacterium]|nr:APC family permease [candidate division KSB1 bacterium]MDZ7364678.1 APC family permease [candidate division KSB1 bacterium]MDZ7402574.1 APC family permease [candidate division KSB1 bacterium]